MNNITLTLMRVLCRKVLERFALSNEKHNAMQDKGYKKTSQ
jgi:hypothetical protein